MPECDPNHPATLGQRQADGLLALASVRVADDADPDRATVVLIAELAAVCDDDPSATAELETGEPLATETARRLVCDSRLSVLVQDAAGRAVGLGTTQRTVTPALRRALMVRDGHCRFGDCTARRFLHGHHIDHWPADTEMRNLALICYQHHHAVHEGGWTLTGDPFGSLIAVHPDGRRSSSNLPQSADSTGSPGRVHSDWDDPGRRTADRSAAAPLTAGPLTAGPLVRPHKPLEPHVPGAARPPVDGEFFGLAEAGLASALPAPGPPGARGRRARLSNIRLCSLTPDDRSVANPQPKEPCGSAKAELVPGGDRWGTSPRTSAPT